jgi:hypothetical protein
VVAKINALGWRTPALLFLGMHAPLGFVLSQFFFAAQPFLNLLLDEALTRELALLLEDPASIEALARRLEEPAPEHA